MTETAIVLPPDEDFGPAAIGPIGHLVHRLAQAGAGGLVLGATTSLPPFDDVPFHPVKPGRGLNRTARYVSGLVAAIADIRPRLVEVHNRPEIALGLARHRIPVSLLLNDDPQHLHGSAFAWQRGRLMRRLALVMTASHWLRARLLDGLEHPARDPVVLPNCIDVPPAAAGPRESLILFAGRNPRDRGADSFVEACARVLPLLPGWRAEMIAGHPHAGPPLDPGDLATTVRHRSHLALSAMQRAAIVVVPSRWEAPFGLVALQAMSCGAAVICSSGGGLPEVVGQAALFADPDQPEALSAALFQLATDVGLRATLAAAGRFRAAAFAAPPAAARLCEVRRAILAR